MRRLALLTCGFLWTLALGQASAGVGDPKKDDSFHVETVCTRGTDVVDCPKLRLRLSGGVVAGKAADVEVSPLPAVSIHVEADLASWRYTPVLHVDVLLTGLPDSDVSTTDPTSVKAFDASAAIVQTLGEDLRFNLYARAGVASRLAEATAASARLPAYASFGIDLHTADGDHWLQFGGGPDQRLSQKWAPAVQVNAGLKVAQKDKARVWLTGSFIRAVEVKFPGVDVPARDWWTVSAQVGF
jgi:hypothetical protein